MTFHSSTTSVAAIILVATSVLIVLLVMRVSMFHLERDMHRLRRKRDLFERGFHLIDECKTAHPDRIDQILLEEWPAIERELQPLLGPGDRMEPGWFRAMFQDWKSLRCQQMDYEEQQSGRNT